MVRNTALSRVSPTTVLTQNRGSIHRPRVRTFILARTAALANSPTR
jgi:hypothetical protein